jgi:hypothetical protein
MTLQNKWHEEYKPLRKIWKVRSKTNYLTNGIINFLGKM